MKIALLGYGIEGASAYGYFKRRYPKATFTVYDEALRPKYDAPEGVNVVSGVKGFHDITADLVIRTPAIAPSRISSNGKISSVTQEFFEVCPLPIIGVTGTKGKGTTASLITSMLQKAGIKTWLVGNIGAPALDITQDIQQTHAAGEQGVVVYELSSFQLWDMKKSPHVAVVLMIEPEHLNVHEDFEEYVRAKSNIVRYQTASDTVIYYAGNNVSTAIAEASLAKKIPYSVGSHHELKVDEQVVANRNDISLYGEHNVENVQAAILAAWQFTQNKVAIRTAIQEFQGLPHRLERVGVKRGVLFINDSFSSAPPASLAAVKSFTQPILLIMGGYDRGLDFSQVAREIAARPNLKKVFLIGQTKEKIAQGFEVADWHAYEVMSGDLDDTMKRIEKVMTKGDVVLLSPGCASFDMFTDFTDRGNVFKERVAML